MENLKNINIEAKEKELNYLNKCINSTKTLVDVAKDRKEQHEKRKAELEEEIRKEGVDPEKIDDEIVSIYEELEALLENIDEMIPYEMLKDLNKLPERD
jgi:chromosome segregation ATPase